MGSNTRVGILDVFIGSKKKLGTYAALTTLLVALPSCSLIFNESDGSGIDSNDIDSTGDSSNPPAMEQTTQLTILDPTAPYPEDICDSLPNDHYRKDNVSVVTPWPAAESDDCGAFENIKNDITNDESFRIRPIDGSLTIKLGALNCTYQACNDEGCDEQCNNSFFTFKPSDPLSAASAQIHFNGQKRQQLFFIHDFNSTTSGRNYTCYTRDSVTHVDTQKDYFINIQTRVIDDYFEMRYSVFNSIESPGSFKIIRFPQNNIDYIFTPNMKNGDLVEFHDCASPELTL